MTIIELDLVLENLLEVEFIKGYTDRFRHCEIVSLLFNTHVNKNDRIDLKDLIDSESKKKYDDIVSKYNETKVTHAEKLEFMRDVI